MKLNSTHIALGVLVVLAVAGGVVMTVWPRASGDIQVVTVAPTATPAPAETPTPSETRVGVYITGAVVNPGVYLVNDGSRLANIILLAGGATAEAELTAVNLAALVRDEDHWHIPERGAAFSPSNGLAGSSRAAESASRAQAGQRADGAIDLNIADVELLQSLPGIGEVKAQAIVSYRETNGGFDSVDALLEVDGIGEGTLEGIRELVAVK